MRKHIIYCLLSVLIFLFLSCSSSDEGGACRLDSVMVKTLYYEQFIGPAIYNPTFSGKIKFEYNDNGQIIKMVGGPMLVSPDSGSEDFFFTDNIVNEVAYQGNVITAQNNYNLGTSFSTVAYTIELDKLIGRTVKDNDQETYYGYEYIQNQIIERKDDTICRTFYFENENLVKVEQILYDYQTGEIAGKIDIFLSNYDTYENLLQGMYFVNGAFYKAFSKNNFRNLERKHYNYIGGQYVENGNFYNFGFNTSVDQNGLVDLFETSCN